MPDLHARRRIVGWAAAAAIGAAVALLPLLPAEAAPTVRRIAGASRYDTAVEISKEAFPTPGVPVAFLATGINFPDALAAGPVAAKAGGPILLTEPDNLPSVTATELDRLNPNRIVVLGGPGAVSDGVFELLDSFSPTVDRVQGATRFETAAVLSQAFAGPVDQVYVTTGLAFPDALAGGPAAIKGLPDDAPILLVEPGSIPSATVAALQALDAELVTVLGGTGAVSDTVKSALEEYSVQPVQRLAGADRYLTSVAVSQDTFGANEPAAVYLATGAGFPDALAGGAATGPASDLPAGPVLLAEGTCLPKAVNDEIDRLDPDEVILLGGEGALSAAVQNRTVCQPPASSSVPSVPELCLPQTELCLDPTSPSLPTDPSLPGFPSTG